MLSKATAPTCFAYFFYSILLCVSCGLSCSVAFLYFAEIYGRSLNLYSWNERKLKQTINLGDDGIAPLEIRFLHNPLAAEGFVGCAVTSNIYRFYKAEDETWKTEKVIQVPSKKVEGWVTPSMSGMKNYEKSKAKNYMIFASRKN